MASSTCVLREHEGMSLQALTIALQHPAIAANQRNICSLLQVSKAWRAAVQQSAASMTDVTFKRLMTVNELKRITGLAAWVAQYRRLLRTLDIKFDSLDDHRHMPIDELNALAADFDAVLAAANQLVELSLATAAGAAASAAGPSLRLQSFSTSVPATARMLTALSAPNLTRLVLQHVGSSSCNSDLWTATLGRFTNLQQLNLNMAQLTIERADKCLAAIQPLKQLTQLKLSDMQFYTDTKLLCTQLKELQVGYGPDPHAPHPSPQAEVTYGGLADLQHLTNLQMLSLCGCKLTDGSSVPCSVESLVVDAELPDGEFLGMVELHKLTFIEFTNRTFYDCSYVDCEKLELLEQLPALQKLSLDLEHRWFTHEPLLDLAAAWRNLPLCDLRLFDEHITADELQDIVWYVGVATKLTRLAITAFSVDADVVEAPGIIVCEHLRALTNLKSLKLYVGQRDTFAVQDAQHLTTLTGLTKLQLSASNSGPFVDAATLCLLALSLTQLKCLSIGMSVRYRVSVEHHLGVSAFPAIGRLTTLESLCFGSLLANDARQGLQFLTGLSRLTKLVGFDEAGREAVQAFWSHIKALRPMVVQFD